MSRQYRITLTNEEVQELERICTGKRQAKQVLYARALLLMDKSGFTSDHWTVDQTAKAVGLTARTLNHLKQRFVEKGLESVLRSEASGKCKRPIKFDGAFAAKLTQIACEDPPAGRSRWTVRLLADRLVELKIVDSISPMTVQRVLKKRT